MNCTPQLLGSGVWDWEYFCLNWFFFGTPLSTHKLQVVRSSVHSGSSRLEFCAEWSLSLVRIRHCTQVLNQGPHSRVTCVSPLLAISVWKWEYFCFVRYMKNQARYRLDGVSTQSYWGDLIRHSVGVYGQCLRLKLSCNVNCHWGRYLRKLDPVIRMGPDGLGRVVATHTPSMQNSSGWKPECKDGHAPVVISNQLETRAWFFPSALVTGRPEACALRMEPEGQSCRAEIQFSFFKSECTLSLQIDTELVSGTKRQELKWFPVFPLNKIHVAGFISVHGSGLCLYKMHLNFPLPILLLAIDHKSTSHKWTRLFHTDTP